MNSATAGMYRRDVEQPEAGGSLAGVKQGASGASERFDQAVGDCGDTGGALQQIEERPFHPEERFPTSVDPPYLLPLYHLTLNGPPLDLTPALSGYGICVGQPGQNAFFPELDDSLSSLETGPGHLGGEINRSVLLQDQPSQSLRVGGEIRQMLGRLGVARGHGESVSAPNGLCGSPR